MIDKKLLEERGITAEGWKKWLAPEDKSPGAEGSRQEKITALRDRIRTRIQNGRDQNVANHKVYWAVDLAWDTPFRQVNPTLLQGLADKKFSSTEDVNKILTLWGFDLGSVLVDGEKDKNGIAVKRLDVPSFFNVFVPLVRAYVTIRWAKITNDRNRNPFFTFEPSINDLKSRMKCEALTHRMGVMASQYGYFNVFKQCVFQMLHYGRTLQFPEEEWHTEDQETADEKMAVKANGAIEKDEKKRMYRRVREGIRYHMPHPTRTFFDESHMASTLNTDTGCDYAGYWRVKRYRDVEKVAAYYNKDKITVGDNGWATSAGANAFFATVYPCTMKFPSYTPPSQNDRETKLLNNYYGKHQMDAAVVVTEYFEKLIPSENGLGDYDYPIWARFVVAGDDTIIYAAPLCYRPVTWYGYDTDEARAENPSLSLEILPFQDQFSNLMTQYLLSCKQNLTNVTFVDTDPMGTDGPGFIEKLKNLGEKILRTRIFVPYSGMKARKSQHNIPNVFHSTAFAQLDTQSIVQAMKILLDTLERVLVMSSQEVAQAATHEQTKAEVTHISDQSSTRLVFTATPVDQGCEAWKQQLYEADMAYGSDDFWTQIPNDPPLSKEELEKMGFTWDEEDKSMPADNKIMVKAKRSAVQLLTFANRRDNMDRLNDPETAVSMLNALDNLLKGPMGPVIGADQALKIINLSAKLAGFPKEFKLENKAPAMKPEEKAAQEQQMLKQFSDEVLQHVKEGMVPILDKIKEHDQAIGQIMQTIQAANVPQPIPVNVPTPQPLPQIPVDPMAQGLPVVGV